GRVRSISSASPQPRDVTSSIAHLVEVDGKGEWISLAPVPVPEKHLAHNTRRAGSRRPALLCRPSVCRRIRCMRRGRRRALLVTAIAVAAVMGVLMGSVRRSLAGAPREGDQFVNLAGKRPLPGAGDWFPFLLRKAWTSLVHRSGAKLVPYD